MSSVLISIMIILIFIFLGMHIATCFLVGSIAYCLLSGSSFSFFATQAYYALDSQSLLAIPLFVLAGILIDMCGIGKVLVDLGEKLMKNVKGGMGAAIPVVSSLFGALSGSGVATATIMSTMLAPRLTAKGWDKRYVAAFIAASAPLGFLIPPNLNAIVFAKVSNATVGALFLSTIIPAFMLLFLYLAINRLTYQKWYKQVEDLQEIIIIEKNLDADRGLFIKQIIPALLFPIIVMGGIYGGIFTATEAGAIGCGYAVLVGYFVYRELTLDKFKESLHRTSTSIATLLMVLPMTMIFTRILVLNDIPELIAKFIIGVSTNRYIIILIMDFILIIAGFFLNPTVMVLVVGPLLMPTAAVIGMTHIQLGGIIFLSVGIGACTPPVSMLLFTATSLCDTTVSNTIKPLLPFLIYGAIPTLILTSIIPAMTEWLPALLLK